MKQCPTCRRTFADDLRYCLDDGSVLQMPRAQETTEVYPQDPETTVVYPKPTPAPAPPPVYHPPPKSSAGKILGVIGIGVVILLLLLVKVGASFLARQQRVAENVNSQSRYFATTPTATPLITPEATTLSSPSVAVEETEKTITPGSYQCEFNRTMNLGEVERSTTLKLRISFAVDKTYLQQGYATVHGTELEDKLIVEEQGSYSQAGDLLTLQDRYERQIDRQTDSWSSWKVPKEGTEVQRKIRNVTPATFQLFDPDENAWFTFTKL
ncbi:MAG: hypothetical protein WAL47_20330 [Pyrinomonadaceae bacterium]